jgi:AraC family transcriptional regulator of arabinose operon
MPDDPIIVGKMGISMKHTSDFVVNRKHGYGEYVFLHFLGPVLIDGIGKAMPGDCILFAPDTPHRYRGDGQGLANDWLHFSGSAAEGFLERIGMPMDVLLHPRSTEFIAPILRYILEEDGRNEPHGSIMRDLLIRQLLTRVSRESLPSAPHTETARQVELYEAFRSLRVRMLDACTEPWTVASLARRTNLSASRFATLYRQFFGISPIDDLIEARLGLARWLLASSPLSIAGVAEACGFRSQYYFSRLFRQRVGCPPRAYSRTKSVH